MKKLNFFAGPSYLHPEILETVRLSIDKTYGLSLLEISHRSKTIGDLFAETKELIRSIMQLKPDKEVLFLHGGASLQYPMIAYNIATTKRAGIIDTGVWSQKCLKEHNIIRPTSLVGSGENNNYNSIPTQYNLNDELGYIHLTTNNTIYGTQFHQFPSNDIPIVADMSSDILSRQLDFNQFGLIYAGLQKNLGTAGGTITIVDPDLLDATNNIPTMLDYRKHITAQSMLNTPPVFAVLVCNITLKWILKNGGLSQIEANNIKKAELLYKEIDRNELFISSVSKESRSLMNVTFNAIEDEIEAAFLNYATSQNIEGLKGHRLKGGFRASIYNALPIEDVQQLVNHMQAFEKNS